MPEYIPTWRRKKPVRNRLWVRAAFRIASALSVALLWAPWGITIPISVQLHRNDWTAWSLMSMCATLLIALVWRMLRIERYAGALVLVAVLCMLGYIALSDPYSVNHLFTFIAMSLLVCGWMGWMAWELEDSLLTIFAIGAGTAVLVSIFWLGVGERILVTCAMGAANELFLEHFDL